MLEREEIDGCEKVVTETDSYPPRTLQQET